MLTLLRFLSRWPVWLLHALGAWLGWVSYALSPTYRQRFEVTVQAYAERYGTITVLYRPARKPWLRPLVDTSRQRPGLATAPATLAGVRSMMRALRRGEAVGLLPDQVPPDGMGVWASFFG